jgi:hypothetical protein
MATTARELIKILEKYEDPDKVVIWQYYTITDFDGDLTNEEFGKVADRVENYEIWSYVYDAIKEEIWKLEDSKKGNQ